MLHRRFRFRRVSAPRSLAESAGFGAFLLASALLVLSSSAQAASDDDTVNRSPHRISAAARVGLGLFPASTDGHYGDAGATVGLGGFYAYAFRYLEIGAGFDFAKTPAAAQRCAFGPLFTLRPKLPLGSSAELGLTLGAGPLWVRMPDVPVGAWTSTETRVFRGRQVSIVPDVRFWTSNRVAVDVGLEARVGAGHDTNPTPGWYLPGGMDMLYAGLVVRAVFSP